jgi:hypothetical protein
VREVNGVYAVERESGRLPGLTTATPRAQRGQAEGA